MLRYFYQNSQKWISPFFNIPIFIKHVSYLHILFIPKTQIQTDANGFETRGGVRHLEEEWRPLHFTDERGYKVSRDRGARGKSIGRLPKKQDAAEDGVQMQKTAQSWEEEEEILQMQA